MRVWVVLVLIAIGLVMTACETMRDLERIEHERQQPRQQKVMYA